MRPPRWWKRPRWGSMALMTGASLSSTVAMPRSKSKSHQFQCGLPKAQTRQTLARMGRAELPPAFLDTPLPEEPAMVKLSMNEIERMAAATDGPVVSEGGCSPSTLSTGQRDASQGGTPLTAGRPGPLAPGRRWSAGRKREVVLRLLRGEAAEL